MARSEEPLRETAASLASTGAQVLPFAVDVADGAALQKGIAGVLENFGAVDVLVVNTGGPPPGTFEALNDEQWSTAFESVMLSAIRAIRAVLPSMRERGFGRIVVVGSSSVVAPLANLTLSNAFRPALAGLVASLAQEVAAAGITVNLVAPGRFDTDRIRELDAVRAEKAGESAEAFRERAAAAIPAGRYGRPDEMGELIAYLASDAAAYLTGQSLLMDGGLVGRS